MLLFLLLLLLLKLSLLDFSLSCAAGPRFLESVTRLAVKRDSSATLHCRVHGDKPLHVAWRRSSSASSAFLSSNYR